jgi:hypothetical protein
MQKDCGLNIISSGNCEAFMKGYRDKAVETAVTTTLQPNNTVVV